MLIFASRTAQEIHP